MECKPFFINYFSAIISRISQEKAKLANAKTEHDLSCRPSDMLFLGFLDEIDINDKGPYSVWVENDQVFLIVKCPAAVHEYVARYIDSVILDGQTKAGLMILMGSTEQDMVNELACNASFMWCSALQSRLT